MKPSLMIKIDFFLGGIFIIGGIGLLLQKLQETAGANQYALPIAFVFIGTAFVFNAFRKHSEQKNRS